MPIWTAPTVDEQPQMRLYPWRIFEFVLNGQVMRRIVGYDAGRNEARTTSPIQKFNPATMRADTRSGRIYELLGPPGGGHDSIYVWEQMAGASGITAWEDVSEKVYAEHIKAQN